MFLKFNGTIVLIWKKVNIVASRTKILNMRVFINKRFESAVW